VSLALETLSVSSRALHRTLPCTLVLPPGRPPEAVLYLLHGGFSHHAEWPERMDLAQMAADWPLAIALPEGGFSLWVRGEDGQDFERYAAWDVPEAVEAHLGLQLSRERRAVAGLSMGGFGALQVGLSYPERYGAVASLSGAFGMTWWNLGRAAGSPFLAALGPPGSETRARVDPFRTLERAVAHVGAEGLPPLFLATGTEDDSEVTHAHRSLHAALEAAGVAHLASERPGGHDWAFWARETPALLAFVATALKLPSESPH
jgi:putative tributyrin esterase